MLNYPHCGGMFALGDPASCNGAHYSSFLRLNQQENRDELIFDGILKQTIPQVHIHTQFKKEIERCWREVLRLPGARK